MLSWSWETLKPGRPILTHPAMGVIREGDLHRTLRLLTDLGRPSPFTDKQHIQAINDHIREVRSSLPPDHPSLGLLNPVKVRFCLDTSVMLNPLLKKWPMQYNKIHDATALLKENWYMARIDLEKYFNQLPVHEDDQQLVGVSFSTEELQAMGIAYDPSSLGPDGRLHLKSAGSQFGVSSYPTVANTCSSAVSRILTDNGIPNTFVTDDFFVCGSTKAECQHHLDQAVNIMIKLGWRLQEDKLILPSQRMPFVGITIDTTTCRLSIPSDKLLEYGAAIASVQADAAAKTLKHKHLESLIGKLGWVSEVLIAGRSRLKRLRACLWAHNRPHRSFLPVGLSTEAKEDLEWWSQHIHNMANTDVWVPFWIDHPPIHASIISDASGDTGFGVIIGEHVYQGLWTDEIKDASSAYKELIPVLLALQLLGPEAAGRILLINSDNLGNVFSINKGS